MSNETSPSLDLARRFIEAIPHSRDLAMKVLEIGDGRAVIEMPYDRRLIADPATGVIHGGAISTLMDTCGGAAVMAHPEAGIATATLGLRIDYMRSATPEEPVIAEATCFHMTRFVGFVRAEARQDGGVVATATGTFSVERAT